MLLLRSRPWGDSDWSLITIEDEEGQLETEVLEFLRLRNWSDLCVQVKYEDGDWENF